MCYPTPPPHSQKKLGRGCHIKLSSCNLEQERDSAAGDLSEGCKPAAWKYQSRNCGGDHQISQYCLKLCVSGFFLGVVYLLIYFYIFTSVFHMQWNFMQDFKRLWLPSICSSGLFGSYLCCLVCVMLFSTSALNVSCHSSSWELKIQLWLEFVELICVEGEKCRGIPALAVKGTDFHSFVYCLDTGRGGEDQSFPTSSVPLQWLPWDVGAVVH